MSISKAQESDGETVDPVSTFEVPAGFVPAMLPRVAKFAVAVGDATESFRIDFDSLRNDIGQTAFDQMIATMCVDHSWRERVVDAKAGLGKAGKTGDEIAVVMRKKHAELGSGTLRAPGSGGGPRLDPVVVVLRRLVGDALSIPSGKRSALTSYIVMRSRLQSALASRIARDEKIGPDETDRLGEIFDSVDAKAGEVMSALNERAIEIIAAESEVIEGLKI